MSDPSVLDMRHLSVRLAALDEPITVVRDVSLTVAVGEIVALVGESGSGKSMACLAAMGLIDSSAGPVVKGEILLEGTDVLSLGSRERRSLAGRELAMIFQDPMTALNPYINVGWQVAEVFRIHRDMGRRDSWREAVAWLDRVGLSDAAVVATRHPHELSGGMRQRVIIAMALACEPKVLFADEPTTALDSNHTIGILRLIRELTHELGTAVLLVTHDLTLARHVADRVVVFYAGEVVEQGEARSVLCDPRHPYTQSLMLSSIDLDAPDRPVVLMPGQPPDFVDLPSGCAFEPRCSGAARVCGTDVQALRGLSDGSRQVRCSEVKE